MTWRRHTDSKSVRGSGASAKGVHLPCNSLHRCPPLPPIVTARLHHRRRMQARRRWWFNRGHQPPPDERGTAHQKVKLRNGPKTECSTAVRTFFVFLKKVRIVFYGVMRVYTNNNYGLHCAAVFQRRLLWLYRAAISVVVLRTGWSVLNMRLV